MNDVSGIADRSNKFEGSLTTAGKYRYHWVYIFHVIFLKKAISRSIISQTNIFNIFPASAPLNSVKTNCNGKPFKKYIPENSLLLTRSFIDLANKSK